MKNQNLPVAVIGAGPVGMAAAAHLSLRKIPFLLFEAGDSVVAASAGASVAAGAPPPQDASASEMVRISMIRRIIQTLFRISTALRQLCTHSGGLTQIRGYYYLRIHAGQQPGSVMRERDCPVAMSTVNTFILPSMTALNVRVFPPGDQCGVSA